MILSDYLPATRPPLPDLKSCNVWLASATLADPHLACSTLQTLLDELEDAPPQHAEYVQILERLRKPMLGAIRELEKKFTAKPLAPNNSESLAFRQACDLWRTQQRAYGRLLRAAQKGAHPELSSSMALLAVRVIGAAAELVIAHCLARRRIDGDLWKSLHGAFSSTCSLGVSEHPVGAARLNETASSIYVQPFLMSLASPYALPGRELKWLRRWISRWSYKVGVSPSPSKSASHAVDVASRAGASWRAATESGPSIRFFDTTLLGHTIRHRLASLKKGRGPASIGLGRDSVQPGAGDLLSTVLRRWCSPPAAREFPRRDASRTPAEAGMDVAIGIAAAHFSISGKLIPDAKKPWEYSRGSTDQIHIFGHTVAAGMSYPGGGVSSCIERWLPLNESANGFRLQRISPGARVTIHQLISLRPHGARQYMLAGSRWLVHETGDSLVIGARALPGLPATCTARQVSPDPTRVMPFLHAFLMAYGAGEPPSLVMPSGWFQRDRLLELTLEEKTIRIRLNELLDRGFDYDHASFSDVS